MWPSPPAGFPISTRIFCTGPESPGNSSFTVGSAGSEWKTSAKVFSPPDASVTTHFSVDVHRGGRHFDALERPRLRKHEDVHGRVGLGRPGERIELVVEQVLDAPDVERGVVDSHALTVDVHDVLDHPR